MNVKLKKEGGVSEYKLRRREDEYNLKKKGGVN